MIRFLLAFKRMPAKVLAHSMGIAQSGSPQVGDLLLPWAAAVLSRDVNVTVPFIGLKTAEVAI